MSRLQRLAWAVLITLALPGLVYAAAAETITIGNSVTGPTAGLCVAGTPSAPTESGAYIQVLDQSIYYTLHSPTATPSSTVGGLAPANTILLIDRASDFRAIRSGGTDARAYVVCVRR